MLTQSTTLQWLDLIRNLGHDLANTACECDENASFVYSNYELIKKHGLLKAMIPAELGGEGISHNEMGAILKEIAHYCSSTSLALSMHQHLLAANIWKYKHGMGGEAMLEKVARENLVLISTGAKDWLESNGTMTKTDGGYLVLATKHFTSQAPVGDIIVTSARYHDPENGKMVLHFPVSMKAEGVQVMDNWYTLGMRGTGSHSTRLENVFVPESAIVLSRPQGEFHSFFNVVLTVAMPLIMSSYVGIAERAAQIVGENINKQHNTGPHLPYLLGELHNELTTARVMLNDMLRITNNFEFESKRENAHEILTRKSIVAQSCINTVNKAIETIGGQAYFKKMELERLYRDVQAANFHPLPLKQQLHFSGSFMLENDIA